MTEIPQLPTTKQFRDAAKTAFQSHNLVMVKSRTRQEMMSGYGIPYEVRIHYNYGYAIALRNKVRLIDIRTPRIDGIEQKLKAAADDIRVWMMLCGVEPYMKIRHSLFADSRITAWCLIS